jgi:hypothetical protein
VARPIDIMERERRQRAFLEAFARTGIISRALRETGLHMPQHYRWLESDPEYARRFAEVSAVLPPDLARVNRKPYPRSGQGPGKVPTGRPVDWEKRHRREEVILAALARTGIVMDAASEAGIFPSEFYRWRRTDPVFREKADKAIAEGQERGRRVTSERLSASSGAMWERDGFRERMSERQRESWSAPELRAAAGDRSRRRMEDPEYREKWLAALLASLPVACDQPGYFDEIDTAEKAYWLGFLLTDGCVRGYGDGGSRLVVKLARKDREHLVKLHAALGARRPIRDIEAVTFGALRPLSVLDVCSPPLTRALISHGVLPRKTHTCEPWDGPSDLMPHYWRGIIDGDGGVYPAGRDSMLHLGGTYAVTEGFRAWAQATCGTTAKQHKRPGSPNFWVINIGGQRQVRCLLAALYDDAPVALDRKKAMADLALHGKPPSASLF